MIGHERLLSSDTKKPAGDIRTGSRRRTGWAAGELNGALNPLPARFEGYGFSMGRATLLRGFTPHFAEIRGVRLRWFEAGEGEPVLLVHGLGGAASNWTLVAPRLAQRRRVIVPDLPGHGWSGRPPAGARLSWYADVLAALLERIGAAPAALAGHSMGGVVVLRLAAQRQELVAGLALVDSAGIASLTRRAAVFLSVSAALKPARRVARFQHAIARHDALKRLAFGYWGADDPASLSAESVLGWLASTRAHVDTATAGKALVRDDPRYDLDRISCPAVVVWGARDRLISVEDGFQFARRLRAPIRVVPGAGHLVIGERPDECAAILAEYLDRIRQVDELPLEAERVGEPR
jgi:pimeloyl-ACP methyl ester carboxylesterase